MPYKYTSDFGRYNPNYDYIRTRNPVVIFGKERLVKEKDNNSPSSTTHDQKTSSKNKPNLSMDDKIDENINEKYSQKLKPQQILSRKQTKKLELNLTKLAKKSSFSIENNINSNNNNNNNNNNQNKISTDSLFKLLYTNKENKAKSQRNLLNTINISLDSTENNTKSQVKIGQKVSEFSPNSCRVFDGGKRSYKRLLGTKSRDKKPPDFSLDKSKLRLKSKSTGKKKAKAFSYYNTIKCPILFDKTPGRERKFGFMRKEIFMKDYAPKYDIIEPHKPSVRFNFTQTINDYKRHKIRKILGSFKDNVGSYFVFDLNKVLEKGKETK